MKSLSTYNLLPLERSDCQLCFQLIWLEVMLLNIAEANHMNLVMILSSVEVAVTQGYNFHNYHCIISQPVWLIVKNIISGLKLGYIGDRGSSSEPKTLFYCTMKLKFYSSFVFLLPKRDTFHVTINYQILVFKSRTQQIDAIFL